MSIWRRRFVCAVALLVCLPAFASDDVSVSLESGHVEVAGLSGDVLAKLAGERRSFEAWSSILRVSINESGPPVLGDYEVVAGTLRFRPMFPFDPGRRYLIRLEVEGTSVATDVGLPAIDRTPTTVVTHVYPTSDVLPENQLKLYVHFSAPMAAGDGLPFVELVDETGTAVIDPFLPLGDAFWDRDHRRYTIFFDPGRVKRGILPNEEMGRPILEGHRYELVIDPSWRDASGLPLAEPFRKAFRAGRPDETPIAIDGWHVTTPSAGTREALVVDFGEPMDHGVLNRSLSVENVAGRVEISKDETRWAFTPDAAWSEGRYDLVALAVLEDLAGNQIGKAFEVDVFERIDSPEDVPETYRIPIVIR